MVAWRTFNIWRTFLFHKSLFVVKEGSSDYKKVERDGSLKNLWLNGTLWNQKWLLYCFAVKNLLEHLLFLRVCVYVYVCVYR